MVNNFIKLLHFNFNKLKKIITVDLNTLENL